MLFCKPPGQDIDDYQDVEGRVTNPYCHLNQKPIKTATVWFSKPPRNNNVFCQEISFAPKMSVSATGTIWLSNPLRQPGQPGREEQILQAFRE